MSNKIVHPTLKLSLKEVAGLYPLVRRYPVKLRGVHGIGKSSFVYQMAATLSETYRKEGKIAPGMSLPVVERRLSQITEGDLLGLPYISKGNFTLEDGGKVTYTDCKTGREVTRFIPMDWLRQVCDMPCVLFLDEFDRGIHEVRMGAMQLADSRTLAGHTLHPDTVIISAVNSGTEGQFSNYGVNTLDPAELDRWTVFDIHVSKADWCEWASQNGVVSPIIQFITNTTSGDDDRGMEYPLYMANNQPNMVDPSPRSWDRLNQAISGLITEVVRTPKASRTALLKTIRLVSAGFVGQDCADAFTSFLSDLESHVSAEDIINGQVTIEYVMANVSSANLMPLIDILTQDWLTKKLTVDQVTNFALFFNALPNDLAAAMNTKMITFPKDADLAEIVKTNLRVMARPSTFHDGSHVELMHKGQRLSISGKLSVNNRVGA